MTNNLGGSGRGNVTPANNGLAPVAGLSLFVGFLAVVAIVFQLATGHDAERAPLRLSKIDTSTGEDSPRAFSTSLARPSPITTSRPERTQIVIGGAAEAVVTKDAGAKRMRFIPRLKPRYRPEGVPIVQPVLPGTLFLAPSDPVPIASESDFTGGQQNLFADYTRAQALDRAERTYLTVVLNRGETLTQTLLALGASAEEAASMLEAAGTVTDPDQLNAGAAIDYAFEPVRRQEERPLDSDDVIMRSGEASAGPEYDVALVRLRFRPDDRHVVTAWRQPDGQYTARIEELEIQKRYAAVAGRIDSSLFMAAQRSQVPPEIMQRFANLFLYDIDFARDIFAGDRFEVVYEALYNSEGEYIGSGDIVFAGMSWRGNSRQKGYYRYDDAGKADVPYFDALGESVARLLMKTPIEGARVTSGYGMRRHPILGYNKAHKGVDFGAPTGTPIMAAGDGKVVRAAMTGSYGHYIKIEHANGFATAYAHLHGYAKGIKAGARVQQGDIIGYVGSTGRSTGPHLHYEVLRGGEHLNPMTLDVATGRKLNGEIMSEFNDHRTFIDTIRMHPFTIAAAATQ